MAITIGKIASLAGVSKTTVSRVLNNKPDVDPETREKILKLIEKKDFQPNAFAKAISSQKSHYVGLLIPHKAEYVFSNPFYTEVMNGVSTEIDSRGYYMILCFAHEINYLDIYKQKRVEGFVLLSPGSFHKNIIESLNAAQVPFVSTAKISEEKKMTFVDVDNFHGATLVTEHLISLGHRRIAYIGKPILSSSKERLEGYKAVLKAHRIPFEKRLVIITETSSVESGHAAMQQLMREKNGPTAVFFANDVMAVGAIKALQESGTRVPEDISIVGFDDIPLASYIVPPLTTVRQPAKEKGIQAARLLINALENKEKPKSIILDVELVIRNSTGPVRS